MPVKSSRKPPAPIATTPCIPSLCACKDPLLNHCMAKRYDIGLALAEILGGCPCRCHRTMQGTVMPVSVWYAARVRKQCDIERATLLNENRAQMAQKKKESVHP